MSEPTPEQPAMPHDLDTCVVCGEPPERWTHWPDGSRVGLCASPECAAALDAMQLPDPARHITAPPSPRDGWDPAFHDLVDTARSNLLYRACEAAPGLDWALDSYPSFGVTAKVGKCLVSVGETEGRWMAHCRLLGVSDDRDVALEGEDGFHPDRSLPLAVQKAVMWKMHLLASSGTEAGQHHEDAKLLMWRVVFPDGPTRWNEYGGWLGDRVHCGDDECMGCTEGSYRTNIWWPSYTGVRLPCCGRLKCRQRVATMVPGGSR